ncbi:hypothetical protein I203_106939 [Kwoniella mangroviensis CBS 8507]|uniref:hypothetical protein n=1 Tax=Kwoniella mangroviensis CBS 8507 TaxID=1296122 RepID=UPI00080D164D|nr:uncharacterized protein I203_08372 [Kwoniella mangroviensis CBS 8507]OCF62571.1 hypothetical protein I203_08372 [Kwoniella mangroviensis CBS 8507]
MEVDEDSTGDASDSDGSESEIEEGEDEDDKDRFPSLFSNVESICFENDSLTDVWANVTRSEIAWVFSGFKPHNVCATYDTSKKDFMTYIMRDIREWWRLRTFTWHQVTNPDFSPLNPAKYLNYHISSINTCVIANHHTGTTDAQTTTAQQQPTDECTCPITLHHMTDFVYRIGPSREPPTNFDKSQKAKCNYVGLYNIPEHYSPSCWSELEKELKSKVKNQPIRSGRVWSKNEKDRMKRWKKEFGSFLVDSKKWVDCPCCGRF